MENIKNNKPNKLNRFTSLPILLDLIKTKEIAFSDPSFWEDRNDVEIILEYKRRKNIKALFAICFCVGNETIHHWKTYANSVYGCCIEFNKEALLEPFDIQKGFRYQNIIYKKINNFKQEYKDNKIMDDDLPFIKREPYQFEYEFRVIWEGNCDDVIQKKFPINLNSINKITLSHSYPDHLIDLVKELLPIEIRDNTNQSTLYKNSDWINIFKLKNTSS